ncbi:hypothetical protein VTJ04DRAFT_4735 [Mycothermus thermophilus]|uniref:uncharacterized protein n=1 Tax=Humicola insolens TaxID=85995 RepID=UPI0037439517
MAAMCMSRNDVALLPSMPPPPFLHHQRKQKLGNITQMQRANRCPACAELAFHAEQKRSKKTEQQCASTPESAMYARPLFPHGTLEQLRVYATSCQQRRHQALGEARSRGVGFASTR